MAETSPPALLRLLIVDDEPPARSRLLRLLAAESGAQVVGQAGGGAEALLLAESLAPDALLLDVQMPEVSGLDVAASLPDRAAGGPAVVFVTAFDRSALQAFGAAAVDYLLKPVDPAWLRCHQPSASRRQLRRGLCRRRARPQLAAAPHARRAAGRPGPGFRAHPSRPCRGAVGGGRGQARQPGRRQRASARRRAPAVQPGPIGQR